MDPLTDDYPHYTPYQYAGNEPIANVDLDGLEPLPSIVKPGTWFNLPQTLSTINIVGKAAPKVAEKISLFCQQTWNIS